MLLHPRVDEYVVAYDFVFLSGQDGHRARAHRVFLFSFHSSLLSVGIARYRSGHVLWGRRSWDSGSTTVVLVEGLGGFGSGNFSARVLTGDASLFKVGGDVTTFCRQAAWGTLVCSSVADHVFLLVREVWVLPFLCIKCIRSSSDDNRKKLPV